MKEVAFPARDKFFTILEKIAKVSIYQYEVRFFPAYYDTNNGKQAECVRAKLSIRKVANKFSAG